MHKKNYLLIVLIFQAFTGYSQLDYRAGIKVGFSYFISGTSSNAFNVSISGAMFYNNNKDEVNSTLINTGLQSSINLYFNGIGNDQLKSSYSVDFHNSVFFHIAEKDIIDSLEIIGQVNSTGVKNYISDPANSRFFIKNGYDYNMNLIEYEGKSAFTLASNFIINNEHRNQVYGSLGLQYQRCRIIYYNDATPFHWLNIGDRKDRWWTGGGYLEILTRKDPFFNKLNYLRVGFNRFTWENDDAYKLSTKLGLKFIPATDDKIETLLNNFGNWFVSYQFNGNRFQIEANNIFPDGQDVIHTLLNFSRHATLSKKSISIKYENLNYKPFYN